MKRVQQLNQIEDMMRLIERLNAESSKLIQTSIQLENEVSTRLTRK
ncbi:hypothetical protein N6H18_14405 [Reichenbachiella agarivorans]|uniref:Uncharacterized protein n=1 Tax=Reichenbachiella agarivorans TaxID=2979464 RepID=A0ABY6CND1_9BACT|nr:hypothetical protein [Reichenbachiella agarivorans]UXP31540.1 hypothetical protein N6H18_14405 [Reichenbachiella agarivorans]